ncbi:alpha-galactosidase [uncultured Microbacterium sp.]|uniref:alpha-galactosidase n=1 Tax=uncultured Microbacterium sp. TaxID=191216 RepID=UPI0028D84C4B|nr:alpha-galactosidase [uncultured Microbacterium sp.]
MIHHLRAAGVSLLVDARGTAMPAVLHWGPDLGDLTTEQAEAVAAASIPAIAPSSVDVPLRLGLVPTWGDGWSGRPGLQVSRDPGGPDGAVAAERARAPRLRQRPDAAPIVDGSALVLGLRDEEALLDVGVRLELSAEGVLAVRLEVTNRGLGPLTIGRAAAVLPVPARASELMDFSGVWGRERRPIRRPLAHGVHAREGRHGRGGHDSAFLLAAGTPAFGLESGEVWAVHAAWSGDTELWAESSPLGAASLAAGELLAPGEIVLAPGETYAAPRCVAVYSDTGMGGVSDRVHPWVRSWSTIDRPRPVTLNTWEAVYFDHSMERLEPLIAAAAQVGVERFVLDDGWFAGRRDDRRALGDWTVDTDVWPEGLHPLVDAVQAAGMEFGLWVEPEMISADSDLARTHPEWIVGRADGLEWRFQRTLDLGILAASDHVFGRLDALLTEYPIAYLKWDHNRDLLDGSAHRQTTAVYALIDRLRLAHPVVEIESCASGGARIDLGMLRRVDRVWPSDTNDALDRQAIAGYASLLVPPEYLGAHLGDERAHLTGRVGDLSFRMATALFGSAGIEWNLSTATGSDLARIAEWIAHYKRLRPLLHGGRVVRADPADPAQWVHGVVSHDRTHAVYSAAMLTASLAAVPPPARLPGLDSHRTYRVRPLRLGGEPRALQDSPPPWYAAGHVDLPGAVLAEIGLPLPLLSPQQALVLELTAL